MFNKLRNKSSIIIVVLSMTLLMGFITGCGDKDLEDWEELYQYKTAHVGDNSKVGNILAELDFPEGYEYKSMEILSDEEPYGLNIYLKYEDEVDFLDESKLAFPSILLFSLVDNLDEVHYFVEDEHIMDVDRNHGDSVTTSVKGKTTMELGKNKKNFKEIYEFCDDNLEN